MVFNLASASADFPSAGLAGWLTGGCRVAGTMKKKAATTFMTRHYSAPKTATASAASAAGAGEGDELRAQLRSHRVSLGI